MKKKVKNDVSVNLNDQSIQLDDVLLQALLNGEEITRDKALTLPNNFDEIITPFINKNVDIQNNKYSKQQSLYRSNNQTNTR